MQPCSWTTQYGNVSLDLHQYFKRNIYFDIKKTPENDPYMHAGTWVAQCGIVLHGILSEVNEYV